MWNIDESRSDADRRMRVGDLRIDVHTRDAGYTVAYERGDATYTSYIPSGDPTALSLVPRVPDRPVLVIPAIPVSVLPGESFRGAFVFPVWVQASIESTVLFDVPSVQLKSTWIGTSDSGEPAYHLESSCLDDTTSDESQSCVPVLIQNSSTAILSVERLLVRVIHLDLFVHEDQLSTNEVRFDFRGRDQESRISFQRSNDVLKNGASAISSARVVETNDIIRKSFYWIRDLTG
jgi:hypothetical protein